MRVIKSIVHTIGIIWGTAMTIMAVEGWIVAVILGSYVLDNGRYSKLTKRHETLAEENR